MARTRKAELPAGEPEAIGPAVDQVISQVQADGTDFNPAELEKQAPSREPGDDGDEQAQPTRNGITKRQFKPAPDPRGEHIIQLSLEDPDFKARLLRSSRDNMWIQFTKNPGKEYTQQIDAAGFDWKSDARDQEGFARGAWIMHIDEDRKWQGHAHAQEVFYDVVNQIRAKNGMEPFVPGAGQAV